MKEEKFTYQIKQLATREDWEKARMEGIGTSEIAAACEKEAVKKKALRRPNGYGRKIYL